MGEFVSGQQLLSALVLAILAIIYQYRAGKLTLDALKDNAASVIFPFIWVVCAFGCFYVIKAAWSLHADIIAETLAYQPKIPDYKPRKPSALPSILAAIVCIGILALLSYGTYVLAFPRVKPAPGPELVVVDPSVLSFDASVPKETFSVFVRDRSDADVYSVQIKMKLSRKSSNDFAFDTPSPKPIMEGSPLTDIQGLRCADANQEAVVMFWIYHIEPHGTREITVTHKSDSTATIASKITYFTTKPTPRTGDRIHATGTFHFDEPLTCNGDITFQMASSLPPSTPPSQPTPPPVQPSFVFVYPGGWVNGNTWDFIVNHRGPAVCYNIEMLFVDQVKLESLRHDKTSFTPSDLNSYQTLLRYPEIDPKGRSGIFAKQFLWTPSIPDHERYTIESAWRDGRVHQDLQVERVDGKWFYATVIKDVETGNILMDCKDAGFPIGPAKARRCFPEIIYP
jgi:hypothetical protein